MYQDENWNAVEGDELTGFLDQIDDIDGKYKVSTATTKVSWRMLPFYESVALIRVQDPNWVKPNLVVYYLTDQGNLFRLNGTSPPIHEVNAKAPIKVTEENVLEYLRFFCFFVRGEEGPFYIAESMDDPNIPTDMDETTQSVIEGTVRPASYEGKNDQGHMLCNAVVFYSNALFYADFAVQPSGMIEMLDDEPIASDLPSRVDQPVA
ncbi:MAG: hypothetical protein CL570_07510 [Alphaproteobacteria bacterium]|nr:hypothetical protein [Alphaproteobacteria bacterium]HCQ70877.1 hypothetical protein [Rhodospirillaceae bacterium]|tara:strand:- start:29745 stop:30365 length:621 start_codon:yes stop_codon:yes gene_type:complete